MQKTIIKLVNKEFLEARKNHKLLIITITFLFFGLMSPLSAYFMPQLIGLISADQGISIQLNPPTQIDSFLQFYKNISQMALIIMIFIFMGNIANEKESGSADFILVKPVKIVDFIISKYISMYLLILIAMVISTLVCAIYTYVLFDELAIFFDKFRDRNNLHFWYDLGHAQVSENLGFVKNFDYLNTFKNKIAGMHLHDISGTHDHQVPGMGDFDFTLLKPYLKNNTIKVLEIHQPATTDQIKAGIEREYQKEGKVF